MQINHYTPKQLRLAQGLYSIAEVARSIDVSRDVLDYHVKHGRCPKPNVQVNDRPRKYFTEHDVTAIAEYFSVRSNVKWSQISDPNEWRMK